MGKKYIIQKREFGEGQDKKPHLLGPYRSVYSDEKAPFGLEDTEYIKSQLLRLYGQGRYQVKSIGPSAEGGKSMITIHFIGDVLDIKPYTRKWTKPERYNLLRKRRYPFRVKVFTAVTFLTLFLVLSGLLINGIKTGMSIDMIIALIMSILITAVIAFFFIDHIFYESE